MAPTKAHAHQSFHQGDGSWKTFQIPPHPLKRLPIQPACLGMPECSLAPSPPLRSNSFPSLAESHRRLTDRKSCQVQFTDRGDRADLTTQQYGRIVPEWVASIELDEAKFGANSLRRTKSVKIFRRSGNVSAVELFVRHSKIPHAPQQTPHHPSQIGLTNPPVRGHPVRNRRVIRGRCGVRYFFCSFNFELPKGCRRM